MKENRSCKSHKRGYILIGIGAFMLLGMLNLGFLIPFAIAVFLIYKGLKLIKGNGGSMMMDSEIAAHPYPQGMKMQSSQIDPLDEWEKNLQNKNFNK